MREQLINQYLSALNCAYTMLGYTNEFFADVSTLTNLKYISDISIKQVIGEYSNLTEVNVHEMVPKLKQFCNSTSGEHIIHSYKKTLKFTLKLV